MDDNHKIPALLPHKLVKALAEYMAFKPDGTAEFGKDLEVDGGASFLGKEINVIDLKSYKFENKNYDISGIFLAPSPNNFFIGQATISVDNPEIVFSGFYFESSECYFGSLANGTYISYNKDTQEIDYDTNGVDIGFNLPDLLAKKYTHTVTITQTSSGKTFSFTASGIGTDLNVDSLQDLETVFGGEKHAGSGTLGSLLDTHASLPSDYTIDGVKIGACTITDDVFIPH